MGDMIFDDEQTQKYILCVKVDTASLPMRGRERIVGDKGRGDK